MCHYHHHDHEVVFFHLVNLILNFFFVTDIHCMRTAKTETFTAFLRLPQHFVSPPVLENVGTESIDPTQCLITRTNVEGIFALDLSKVSNLEKLNLHIHIHIELKILRRM